MVIPQTSILARLCALESEGLVCSFIFSTAISQPSLSAAVDPVFTSSLHCIYFPHCPTVCHSFLDNRRPVLARRIGTLFGFSHRVVFGMSPAYGFFVDRDCVSEVGGGWMDCERACKRMSGCVDECAWAGVVGQ